MKLSEKEEKIYKEACEFLRLYELYDMKAKRSSKTISENEIKYKAMVAIKTLAEGIKRGDKFFKVSSNKEIHGLSNIITASIDNDLIIQPIEYFGIGG